RELSVRRLDGGLVVGGDEARASRRRGEDAVGIETRASAPRAFRIGPLLRPVELEQGVGEPSDVQVAAAGALAVLIENVFGGFVFEEPFLSREECRELS